MAEKLPPGFAGPSREPVRNAPERKSEMPETTIRMTQGRPDDADAVRALTREAYAKWLPVIGREPLPMTADYATALRIHGFDVLWVGDTMAGLIETVPKADHLLIENVAVSPSFRAEASAGCCSIGPVMPKFGFLPTSSSPRT